MKIQNQDLEWLAVFLSKMEINAKGSRMRMKFNDILKGHFIEFQKHLADLIEIHAEKENGKPKTEEIDGNRVYVMKDQQEYKKDYKDLACEYIFIEENEENKDMLQTVSQAFLNYDGLVSGLDANLHDIYCTSFENLKY